MRFSQINEIFANGKTTVGSKNQQKFVEDSFGSKCRSFSKLFVEFRQNSLSFPLHNTVCFIAFVFEMGYRCFAIFA